jgi:hypothetical protein
MDAKSRTQTHTQGSNFEHRPPLMAAFALHHFPFLNLSGSNIGQLFSSSKYAVSMGTVTYFPSSMVLADTDPQRPCFHVHSAHRVVSWRAVFDQSPTSLRFYLGVKWAKDVLSLFSRTLLERTLHEPGPGSAPTSAGTSLEIST